MSKARLRHGKHTPLGEGMTGLVREILRANGRLLIAGDRLTKEFGLTAARWRMLSTIRDQPKTVAQIGRDQAISRQSIQQGVDSLCELGLVALIDNPGHRRAKLVQVTETGAAALEGVYGRQVHWSNVHGAPFTEEELSIATDVLNRLRSSLS